MNSGTHRMTKQNALATGDPTVETTPTWVLNTEAASLSQNRRARGTAPCLTLHNVKSTPV
jgi:hypothetical protein